jgi:hypothetical protein
MIDILESLDTCIYKFSVFSISKFVLRNWTWKTTDVAEHKRRDDSSNLSIYISDRLYHILLRNTDKNIIYLI